MISNVLAMAIYSFIERICKIWKIPLFFYRLASRECKQKTEFKTTVEEFKNTIENSELQVNVNVAESAINQPSEGLALPVPSDIVPVVTPGNSPFVDILNIENRETRQYMLGSSYQTEADSRFTPNVHLNPGDIVRSVTPEQYRIVEEYTELSWESVSEDFGGLCTTRRSVERDNSFVSAEEADLIFQGWKNIEITIDGENRIVEIDDMFFPFNSPFVSVEHIKISAALETLIRYTDYSGKIKGRALISSQLQKRIKECRKRMGKEKKKLIIPKGRRIGVRKNAKKTEKSESGGNSNNSIERNKANSGD